MAVAAQASIGTIRSLLPLPMHRTKPTSRLTPSILRPTSSETRKPVAYNTSSSARSRSPFGLSVFGASKSLSTSSSDRTLGSGFHQRGCSTVAVGFSVVAFSRIRNLCNPRTAAKARVADLGLSASVKELKGIRILEQVARSPRRFFRGDCSTFRDRGCTIEWCCRQRLFRSGDIEGNV